MSLGNIAAKPIPMVGFVAPSGTGKTTLLRKLVPLLRERGLSVGYLKHTHHAFQLDTPGKDSYEVAEAGAAQVMLASASGWALMDHRAAAVADLADADLIEFAARFDAEQLDLLLVEGFHRSRYPKIEVHRSSNGKAPMYPQDTDIIAVVTDTRLPGDEHPPELPIDDPAAVADFIKGRLADGCFRVEDPRDALLDNARWKLDSGGQSVTASVRRFASVRASGSHPSASGRILDRDRDRDRDRESPAHCGARTWSRAESTTTNRPRRCPSMPRFIAASIASSPTPVPCCMVTGSTRWR
jgi:molybdopterin-guanine dinucleotide biosynthesis protein B